MVGAVLAVVALVAGVAAIVWGAETFAEHLAGAAAGLGVNVLALAVLLAGAEPEELATSVAASLRGVPAIAFGDVVGANVAICTVALGVAAVLAPVPFGRRVRRYALGALPAGAVMAAVAWDGRVGRGEAVGLVALYAVYVAAIWIAERRPPVLGEVGEMDEVRQGGRVGRDLVLVVAGVAAMVAGAAVLVEAARTLSGVEATQTRLGLTLIGFATAFELVVLAVATARRGMTDTVVAAVVGSYAHNATMSLAAGALARPLGWSTPPRSARRCWPWSPPSLWSGPRTALEQAHPPVRGRAAPRLHRLPRACAASVLPGCAGPEMRRVSPCGGVRSTRPSSARSSVTTWRRVLARTVAGGEAQRSGWRSGRAAPRVRVTVHPVATSGGCEHYGERLRRLCTTPSRLCARDIDGDRS